MSAHDTNGMHPVDQRLLQESRWDFSDLNAVFINCTLKRSPEPSNAQALADRSIGIMHHARVGTEVIRAVDHDITTGVYPDMTEHGWVAERVAGDLREGEHSRHPRAALADLAGREVIGLHARVERLYGNSQPLNADGQWAYYGRVGGCIITGNEDGAKHCAMNHPLFVAASRLHDSAQADSG